MGMEEKRFGMDEAIGGGEVPEEKSGVAEVLRAYRERLGRAGGLARAAKLSPERRREIAVNAGRARGKKKP